MRTVYVDGMTETNVVQLGTTVAVQPHRVLHRLMSMLDISDTEMGTQLEVSRQTVHGRRTGRHRMSVQHIEEMAKVLEVDPRLFLGTELEAIRWLIENRPELFDGSNDGDDGPPADATVQSPAGVVQWNDRGLLMAA